MTVDRRRVRALARRLERHFGDLAAAPGLGSARRADPHGAVPAHERPERRARLRAPREAVPDLGRCGPRADGRARRHDPVGGLANTKAARIQAILREIHLREGRYDLSGLRARSDAEIAEYLSSLPGVGPKTAAVVMAFAFGRETIPVDTHVHRVATRLGLVPKTSAERAQRLLEELGARRAQDPDARGADPARSRDLQGGPAAVRGLPAVRAVPDGAGGARCSSAGPLIRPGAPDRSGRGESNPRLKLGKLAFYH